MFLPDRRSSIAQLSVTNQNLTDRLEDTETGLSSFLYVLQGTRPAAVMLSFLSASEH